VRRLRGFEAFPGGVEAFLAGGRGTHDAIYRAAQQPEGVPAGSRRVWVVRFASDGESSKGSLVRRAGTGSSLASEVEFSKGYRHFASVITLAKCGIAVKAEVSL